MQNETPQLALAAHWPEYLMEAAELGIFMIAACAAGVLLDHPASPVHQAIASPALRRVLGGLAMGLTAIALFTSTWGKRSGAHLNPAVTLTFYVLGKVKRWDAVFYVVAQFLGGISGVLAARLFLDGGLRQPSVNYVATTPGPAGVTAAFAAEMLISFLMMTVVLNVSNSPKWSRFTPACAAFLVAAYIAVEAPFSGMSMNPARTFGSALPAQTWTAIWLYFIAPPAGMLLAGTLFRLRLGIARVFCAKLHHHNNDQPCIFNCRFGELQALK